MGRAIEVAAPFVPARVATDTPWLCELVRDRGAGGADSTAMRFASDNTAPVSPEILAAVAVEAQRVDWPYGEDAATASLEALIGEIFEHEVRCYPVVTGTAANALALASLVPPYGSIACTPVAHVLADECGAVEHLSGGARLVPIAHRHGRMDPSALLVETGRRGHDVHAMALGAITLTQQTEAGTAYSVDQISELSAIAREHGLAVHLDGARLANALTHLGCSPADATWRAGVQVLSLGATKDGAIGAEAIVVFDPDVALDVDRRRKRAGHLLSKLRFVSVQLRAWLTDDLWLRNAAHANAAAGLLAAGVDGCGVPGVQLALAPEGNEVFVRAPDAVVAHLRAAGAMFFQHELDGEPLERFVTSWATTDDEVDAFLDVLASAPR